MYFASANPVPKLCFYWRYIPQVLCFCKSRPWTMFYWRYIPHVLCFCKSRHWTMFYWCYIPQVLCFCKSRPWTMFLLTLYTTCTLLLQNPVPGLCFYWRYIPHVLCFCKSRHWIMFLLTLYTTCTLLLQIPSLDYVFIDVIYHMYFASANPVPGLCFYWRYIPHVLCFCKSRPWTMFLLTIYTTSTLLL